MAAEDESPDPSLWDRTKSFLHWGSSGLATPYVKQYVTDPLTEHHAGESTLMAMLRGAGAGAIEGASDVVTAPFALAGEAAAGVRAIGRGAKGLKGLLGIGDEAGDVARVAGQIDEGVGGAARAAEPGPVGSPRSAPPPQDPAVYTGAERRASVRPDLMDPAEEAAYQTMREKLATGQPTGTPGARAMFAEKQRVEDVRKAEALARGELDTRTLDAGTPEPALVPKPKLTAPEVRAMLDKRAGLKESLSAKGKEVPAGSFDTADKLGVQYRRAKDLGTEDLRELGKLLKQHERGLLKDEVGAVAPALLTRGAGAVTGGLTGAAAGDTPEEQLGYGALGAIAGGTLGARFGHHLESGASALHAAGRTAADVQRSAMLAGYAPLKALLGGAGSIPLTAADIALTEGLPAAGKAIVGGVKGLKNAPGAMWKAATGATDPLGMTADEFVNSGLLSIPGRVMSTSDAGVREVLKGMGRSEDLLEDALLTGSPRTEAGQHLLKAAEKKPLLRNILTPVGLKTGIKAMEQGAKYLGGGAEYGNATTAERLKRALLGVGGIAAGTLLPDELRDSTPRGLAIAAAGPLGIPVAIGEGMTAKKTEGTYNRTRSTLGALLRETPLPRNVQDPKAILSRFVPRWAKPDEEPKSAGSSSTSRARATRTTRTRATRPTR